MDITEEAAQVKSLALVQADAAVRHAVEALRALSYQDYLRSEHWLDFRDGMLKLHPTCQRCHTADSAQVHHASYDYLGRERPDDVWVLCGECHLRWHEEHPHERLSTPADSIEWAGRTRRFGR